MSCKGLFDDGKVHRLQNTNKDTTILCDWLYLCC